MESGSGIIEDPREEERERVQDGLAREEMEGNQKGSRTAATCYSSVLAPGHCWGHASMPGGAPPWVGFGGLPW